MQFHAGYCLDSVWSNLIENGRHLEKISGLLKTLSTFEVNGLVENETKYLDPIVAVANNIITRGLPTKPTTFVEETIIKETKQWTKEVNDLGNISYEIKNGPVFSRLLYRALHLVDPKIKPENIDDDNFSFLEKRFIKENHNAYSHPFLSQIWESQKYLETIIEHDKTNERFKNQRVDFAIKFPYLIFLKLGLVVETDGKQHEIEEQKRLDCLRDRGIELSNWFKTSRIKYQDTEEIIKEKLKDLENILDEEYFKNLKENYEHPLSFTEEGKAALKLVLTPIGVARIQKTIIELVLKGILKFDSKIWEIGIIERDIACGELALKDFEGIFYNLFELEGKNRKLPKIDFEIFNNSNPQKNKSFDVVIDISILQRKGLIKEDIALKSNHSIVVRSSFSSTSKRNFYTADLIKYPNFKKLNKEEQNNKKEALIYFLQWIFRKNAFRPGQLKIVNAILQLKNTLALLPTGGGKSLTYQLSSFLQPGITIVVDPIKSLMKDQYQSLLKMKIDSSIVINSAIKDALEKKKLMEEMTKGESLFVFLSPERFLIKEFREKLIEAFNDKKTYFSYCVIDEVHCVSEWGHDFRTAYLRLGENARNFCKRKNGEPVVLIGLTATASYDVLTDVQRELEIKDKNVIKSDYLERPELQYHVVGINENDDEKEKSDDSDAKNNAVKKLISKMPEIIKESNKLCFKDIKKKNYALDDNLFQNKITWKAIPGLVFCPYRGEWFGVKGVANKIKREISDIDVGTFMGSSNKDENEEKISSENQDKFLNNELDLMVATKAFGMGIDKPNIRFTIHLNYPSSIESFYQEAGRSGRDKRLALCFIIYNKKSAKDKEIPLNFHNNSFKGIEKEKWVLAELITRIEKELEILEYGDKKSIVINFNNDTDRKIKDIVQNEVGGFINLFDIQTAYTYCLDPEEFIKKITKNTKRIIKNKDIESEVKNLFWKWRGEEETAKAIYRLSAIGVIDDYTINYKENSYTVEICRKTDQELYLKYLKYLIRYLSKEEAKNEADLVSEHKGNSMIQKCTGCLIEFVYREIESKRRQSIDSMESACMIGLQKGSASLEEIMKMYFESKYYNQLIEDTNNGKEYNIELVWKYIKSGGVVGGKIDNLKHLRGATMRLLNDNPNNGALLLMNAFSYFVLENKNKEIRKKAAEDIVKAFETFKKEKQLTPREYFGEIDTFKSCILKSNSKIDKIMEQTFNLLEIKFHNSWLKNYNLKNIN